MAFFKEKKIPKFVWNHKGPQIAKVIFKKTNKVESLTLPELKLYYNAIEINPIWYWHKHRYINDWNKIEIPENKYAYSQLIFDKGTENRKWGKDSIFMK